VGNTDNEFGLFKTITDSMDIRVPNALWQWATRFAFTCSTAKVARYRVQHQVPTWRFRYFGDFPNMQLSPDSGAWHGSEISLIFNTTAGFRDGPDTPNEVAFGKYMRKIWATFAKNPTSGLLEMGLKAYDPSGVSSISVAF
jgi:cholinesterase